MGERIVARLRDEGATVSCVRMGPAFDVSGDHSYELNPAEPKDYDALIGALNEAHTLPRRIAHLWSIGQAAPHTFSSALDRGFYSVLFLVQALGRHGRLDAPLDLTIIGDGPLRAGAERLASEAVGG